MLKPLIRGTRLRCNGEMCWINFKYEQLSYFYFYCGMIRHGERMCGKKKEDSQNSNLIEDQFGEWLRVSNERGFNKVKSWRKKEGMNLMASKAQILAKGCEARLVGAKIGFASCEVVEGEKENRKNINTVREAVERVTSGKESSLREEN